MHRNNNAAYAPLADTEYFGASNHVADSPTSYQADALAADAHTAASAAAGGESDGGGRDLAAVSRRRSSLSALSDLPHIFSAFGMWSPFYFLGLLLSCFLAAFAIGHGRECDGDLQTFLVASAAGVFAFMIAFMLRDVREQARSNSSINNDSHTGSRSSLVEDADEDGCDWLLWTMRGTFLAMLAGLAIYGHLLLAGPPSPALKDSSSDSSAAASEEAACGEWDPDLVEVCWWMMVVEGSVAAVSAVLIALQVVAAACGWG